MLKIRDDLRNGLIAFLCFLALIVATDYFLPFQLDIFEYRLVSLEDIAENSGEFEGELVSTSARISATNVSLSESVYYANTSEGVILLIPFSLCQLEAGDRVNVRGKSLLESMGYIEVYEIHVADQIGPILRSAPGIVAFVILFFIFFKIDFDNLAFVPRRDSYA
jgi:hypothetical protein